MSEEVGVINLDIIEKFSKNLTDSERDSLKYRLSLSAIEELKNINGNNFQFDDNHQSKLNAILSSLVRIQPYRNRVPEFGIAYRGRPDFITDDMLEKLIIESEYFRSVARPNLDQYIYQVETPNNSTISETLAESKELHDFVCKYAGPVLKSYVTSYLYYNIKGQCSRPHIDNAFTSITVMLGLKQDIKSGYSPKLSSSFIYWPGKRPLEYRLLPGEVSIFFGACALHGRTTLEDGESTSLLLMSFRPEIYSI